MAYSINSNSPLAIKTTIHRLPCVAFHYSDVLDGTTVSGPSEPWWKAFGSGGLDGEPPLMEELEINLSHIQQKTLAVLNPIGTLDKRAIEDSDLAGPLLFFVLMGVFLLLSGKASSGYVYGIAMIGWLALYALLNMMSENGVDLYRTASVLGYCMLPNVILALTSVLISLRGTVGYIMGVSCVLWCTVAASSMFVTLLGLNDQRILVAYPVGLFYACFALVTIF